ncbi:ThiF family adenylyltransferase [Sphingobacterium sp. HJSM2_6]|uniref:ThiF family adenylyltransferase n=1 Tax=Sphingobacterium sp. HJSM2_6 TaxID=3366264 RepID=UPI003BD42131
MSSTITSFYRTIIYQMNNPIHVLELDKFKIDNPNLLIIDYLERQVIDLYKCRFPQDISLQNYPIFYQEYVQDQPLEKLGSWVYYPWKNALIHLLPETDFIEVRTNRNQLKLEPEEQALLSTKTIGIIGLSIGQSIAVTIAMERIGGTLKLADFDSLDLSNLNRLRSSVFNLGENKAILAAREIAEIDPYINVEVYDKGLTSETIAQFFNGNQPLDLLIEVCDGFEMKVQSRLHARQYGIPVIMETNDRCMLDIERFDLEPERPLFHGLIDDTQLDTMDSWSPQQKMEVLFKIVNFQELSLGMKKSLPEIGKTLKSWPQLASEVMLGAGVTSWAARKLLLNQPIISGRHYIDLENQIIKSNS